MIDCHETGSAVLALAKEKGIELSDTKAPKSVTASLQVKYLKPTLIGGEIESKGKIKEIGKRKVIIEAELFASGVLCVVGEVISVLDLDDFGK